MSFIVTERGTFEIPTATLLAVLVLAGDFEIAELVRDVLTADRIPVLIPRADGLTEVWRGRMGSRKDLS